MTEKSSILNRLKYVKARYFPERQLFLRSEGRVSFITIPSSIQIATASALSIAIVWAGITSYAYLTRDLTLEQKNAQIANISADYQSLSADFSALEKEIEQRAARLEERQRFLEQVAGQDDSLPLESEDTVYDADAVEEAEPETDIQLSLFDRLIGTSVVEENLLSGQERREILVARLKSLTERQNRQAAQYLAAAQAKNAEIDAVLTPTSVTSAALLERAEAPTLGAGGPFIPAGQFEPVFAADDAQVFADIIDNMARLKIVTKMLESFPAGEPAAKYYLSSKFGRRRDPINKTWSNHYALDLAGWPGTAIQAAAAGKVVKAGFLGPYGQMIEIDHGNGFRTRYGHMRKLRVKKGEKVIIGQRIGDMGKTGRVTDTHLHYEVWFNGKVIDPMPFIKAGSDVLEIQRRYKETS